MSRVEKGTKVLKNTNRYDAIDGLRAYSAIGIILMHVLANGDYSMGGFIFNTIIPSFTNLTFLFMIISGFSMCCGYYDKIINNKITLSEFYSKRFAKAWPFFALLCVFDFIISPSVNSLREVFANLTLCFGLLPNANISVIGVGWFLGLVFVFYLIFPFFCYLISDKRRAWAAFAVALAFNLFCSDYFGIERTNMMYSAMFFLAGGLIFVYREKLEIIFNRYRYSVLGLCLVTVIGYFVLDYSVITMIVMFSVWLIYAIGNFKKGILVNPVTKYLSGISMEIYLSHMVIYRVLEKVGLIHIFGQGALSYVVTSVVVIMGTTLFATVVQKGFYWFSDSIKNR